MGRLWAQKHLFFFLCGQKEKLQSSLIHKLGLSILNTLYVFTRNAAELTVPYASVHTARSFASKLNLDSTETDQSSHQSLKCS